MNSDLLIALCIAGAYFVCNALGLFERIRSHKRSTAFVRDETRHVYDVLESQRLTNNEQHCDLCAACVAGARCSYSEEWAPMPKTRPYKKTLYAGDKVIQEVYITCNECFTADQCSVENTCLASHTRARVRETRNNDDDYPDAW
jgi:hypothetical protein